MATHPQLIPSQPDTHQPKYPGDEAFISESRMSRPVADQRGQSLPPEPGNLSLHELAQWWDRTLTGNQTGMPYSPDVSPLNTSGLS